MFKNSIPTQRTVRLLLFLAMPVINGCGDAEKSTYPVTGIVRFADGKLLRNGSIEFEIIGREKPVTARGRVGPDGTFTLGTFEARDGAVQGQHRVVVISDHAIGNGVERPGMIPESTLHSKYRAYGSTDLRREVKPQVNHFIFDLDYAPTK